MGLIGVLFVELFQYWQIVDYAWLEFLKLLGFTAVLLAVGTLPYIDNMAHIGTVYLYTILTIQAIDQHVIHEYFTNSATSNDAIVYRTLRVYV